MKTEINVVASLGIGEIRVDNPRHRPWRHSNTLIGFVKTFLSRNLDQSTSKNALFLEKLVAPPLLTPR